MVVSETRGFEMNLEDEIIVIQILTPGCLTDINTMASIGIESI